MQKFKFDFTPETDPTAENFENCAAELFDYDKIERLSKRDKTALIAKISQYLASMYYNAKAQGYSEGANKAMEIATKAIDNLNNEEV